MRVGGRSRLRGIVPIGTAAAIMAATQASRPPKAGFEAPAG